MLLLMQSTSQETGRHWDKWVIQTKEDTHLSVYHFVPYRTCPDLLEETSCPGLLIHSPAAVSGLLPQDIGLISRGHERTCGDMRGQIICLQNTERSHAWRVDVWWHCTLNGMCMVQHRITWRESCFRFNTSIQHSTDNTQENLFQLFGPLGKAQTFSFKWSWSESAAFVMGIIVRSSGGVRKMITLCIWWNYHSCYKRWNGVTQKWNPLWHEDAPK